MEERPSDVRWRLAATRVQDLGRRARRFVQERPLQAIAFTIGLGFVVGKVLHGRED
jgi:ElaB/YqjD/DUF883 family membrane-anchored ribosome-binding protein